MADLERRIKVLEDMEAIKQLKARYWRSVDKKLWNEWADCFVEDAIMDIPPMGKLQGKKQIVQVVSETIGSDVTVHQGHSPEIEITSDTTARGTWSLQYHAFHEQPKLTFKLTFSRGWGLYKDEYVKENGRWKIRTTKLTPLYTEREEGGAESAEM